MQDLLKIDITLTHPTLDPKRITELLSINPTYCWKSGDYIGGFEKQSTRWHGRLSDNSTADDFDGALQSVIAILVNHKEFLANFVDGGGTIELVLNQGIEWAEGKVLELQFYPDLLAHLGTLRVGLCVQGWNRFEPVA